MAEQRQVGSEHARGDRWALLERPATAIPLLLAFCALISLPRLGQVPLWEPDEPRYAEVAREMVESGDFVTSRVDYVRYFDKPPLLFWMMAGSFRLLGESEFAARLPTALCALAGVVVCYLLARSMFGALAGLFAGAVLGTSTMYLGLGVLTRFDVPMTFLISLALLCFWRGATETDPRRARRLFLGMYPALAFGTLMKGPVAPGLVGLIILIYLVLTRNLRVLARMQLVPGMCIFAAIAAPWFVLAERANPGMLRFFFLGENISRFASTSHGHAEPIWYFLVVLVIGMLPWTALLPAIVGLGIRSRRSSEQQYANGVLLCLIWVGTPLIFFSLGRSKELQYILPAWPALAALSGAVIARFVRVPTGQPTPSRAAYVGVLIGLAVTVLVTGIGGIMFARSNDQRLVGQMMGMPTMLLGATAAASIAIVLGLMALRRIAALLLLVVAMGGLMSGLVDGMIALGAGTPFTPLASRARDELSDDDVLVAYKLFPTTICFFTGRRVVVVGKTPPEFDFDPDGARRDGILVPNASRMTEILASGDRVLAFADSKDYLQLKSTYGGPLYELDRRDDIVLFSNRPSRRGARGTADGRPEAADVH